MSKDYYKILELNEFESAENIKAAYRKLARKYHPDIAGASFIGKFKEINEAYEILSNKIKKEEYDRARRFYNYAKGEKTESNKPDNKSKSEDNTENTTKTEHKFSFKWEEFVAKRQQSKNSKKADENRPIKGKDIFADIEITTLDAITGADKVVNMLQTEVCPKCNGKKFAKGTICPYCNGKGEKTDYKKFNIKIPAGIKNHSKIRLAGEGEKGKFGGSNGDLYITVHIKESSVFKTDGLNILKNIPVTPYEAVLGANIKVNTINGTVSLKISPNTQNGQKFRLAGCGISQNNTVGDMIVTIEIKIPKSLSEEELDLYKKLSEVSTSNVRDSIYDR